MLNLEIIIGSTRQPPDHRTAAAAAEGHRR